MPLPNGVNPSGAIASTCPSAGWLGNRGELHDAERRVRRDWKLKAWVTCQLSYKGWNRKPLMQPGRYTELFFLDEATALAAGHRPCGMCRKPSYSAFKSIWTQANGMPPDMPIGEMDKLLHAERTNRLADGAWVRRLADLPPGVMVHWNNDIHLWSGSSLRFWAPEGYGAEQRVDEFESSEVRLATPPSIVETIAAGYPAQLHKSA